MFGWARAVGGRSVGRGRRRAPRPRGARPRGGGREAGGRGGPRRRGAASQVPRQRRRRRHRRRQRRLRASGSDPGRTPSRLRDLRRHGGDGSRRSLGSGRSFRIRHTISHERSRLEHATEDLFDGGGSGWENACRSEWEELAVSGNFDLRHDQMCVGKGDAQMQLTCSPAIFRHNLGPRVRIDRIALRRASITPAVHVTHRPLQC